MFVGHFAAALAAKPAAPRVNLAWLMAAAQLLDLIWPILVLAGVEHVRIAPGITAFTPFDFYDYPISHSLLTSAIWSVLLGGIWFAVRRSARESAVLGALVFSHWVLDFVTHRPDVPLAPGHATKVGLGLWNSVQATLTVETAMYAVGIWLYLRTTGAKRRWGFWALAIVIYGFYLGAAFGPPPPDVKLLAGSALAMLLLLVAAYFVDRRTSGPAR